MAVAGEENENVDIVRGQRLLIHVVENNEIRIILLYSVRASCVDYLVGVKADAPDLVGKTFVRKVCKEIHFRKIILFVKVLKPSLNVWLQAVVGFKGYVPMLVIDERGGLGK